MSYYNMDQCLDHYEYNDINSIIYIRGSKAGCEFPILVIRMSELVKILDISIIVTGYVNVAINRCLTNPRMKFSYLLKVQYLSPFECINFIVGIIRRVYYINSVRSNSRVCNRYIYRFLEFHVIAEIDIMVIDGIHSVNAMQRRICI